MTSNSDTQKIIPSTAPSSTPKKFTPTKMKTAATPFVWFEGPYNHVRGESALWVAVITQAMMDALSKSRNPEQLHHKQMAIQWLTGGSKDFTLVCLHAGFDPDYVRRKAKKALVAPTAWRAAPGKGKRYLERKAYRQKTKQKLIEKEEDCSGVRWRMREEPTKDVVIIGPWAG